MRLLVTFLVPTGLALTLPASLALPNDFASLVLRVICGYGILVATSHLCWLLPRRLARRQRHADHSGD